MEVSDISYRIIADLLRARTGQQLSESRRWRIGTALSGVFRDRGISNLDQLVCMLAEHNADDLAQDVVEALLNNETYFYRDRIMFELLSQRVLPDLAKKRADTKRLSIWSAGCSTGQEALSLAMLFADNPSLWKGWKIDILGTDISEKAIRLARRGIYSQFEVQRGLGVAQMLTHFSETSEGWVPSPDLRDMIVFKPANILEPIASIKRFDLVLCRNVLLYFDSPLRTRAFNRIAGAMHNDGWLMLGSGETTVGHSDRFLSVEGHQGLFVPRLGAKNQSELGQLNRRSGS
ncbi:CheR family methyltransferase [Pontixanthobacter aquaemixtae]|uniref:Protein-glutamate O-methyltransferase CheR n=1 Tax=Pontixanthobacter aquaemixtae TaxID=1958940 RepID=A0A844ZP78_9SPHN|nr:CheR family methyltransferase [Pontixanthobacter aquaemixtae]MXO89364.1 protein-glutamate O-methyltransferase CheR [Pontixanthobacter aquaemixtae]